MSHQQALAEVARWYRDTFDAPFSFVMLYDRHPRYYTTEEYRLVADTGFGGNEHMAWVTVKVMSVEDRAKYDAIVAHLIKSLNRPLAGAL